MPVLESPFAQLRLIRQPEQQSEPLQAFDAADEYLLNHLAEQALRMAKVKQKISGCFRTGHGADTFFTIRSYLATMTKQKHNLFECLVSVLNSTGRCNTLETA